MFLFGLLLLPACIHHHMTEGYTQKEIQYGTIGSAISCFANIILYNAIAKGLGGPKGALAHLQGPVHTILSAIFLQQFPNAMQISGLCSAVLGAIMITAG